MKTEFRNISFRLMLQLMMEDACEASSDDKTTFEFYWEDGDGDFHRIVECDLLRGRFITDNQDFSCFEWELKESHIYMKR